MRAALFALGVAALAGLAVGQYPEEPPPEEPSPEEPPPEEEFQDPCELPEPPWYCNPVIEIPGGQPSVQAYTDELTGFTFAQYDAQYSIDENRIFFRVALPETVPEGAPYDTVVQFQAPNSVGWAALSWGGMMIDSPITMAWANCSNVVVTNRYTPSRVFPPLDDRATFKILDVGTYVNDTHWQFTATCKGCTSWTDPSEGARYLAPTGVNTMAWAYANLPPANPESKDSSFAFHDVYGYFDHDFSLGLNSNFESLIATNSEDETATPTSAACAFTWTPPPGAIVVTETKTVTVATATVTATVTITPSCS